MILEMKWESNSQDSWDSTTKISEFFWYVDDGYALEIRKKQ